MGLFDFFKKKTSTLKSTASELSKQIFSDGEIEHYGNLISKFCNNRIDNQVAQEVYAIAKARFALNLSIDGDDMIDGDYMIDAIINDSADKLNRKDAKEVFKMIFFQEKYNSVDNKLLDDSLDMLFGLINNGEKGVELKNSAGEFGCVPTNPIPLKGILACRQYLLKLKTEDGQKIDYEPAGDYEVENFKFPVSLYKITDLQKQEIGHLFIYTYHGTNTTKIPKGFIL